MHSHWQTQNGSFIHMAYYYILITMLENIWNILLYIRSLPVQVTHTSWLCVTAFIHLPSFYNNVGVSMQKLGRDGYCFHFFLLLWIRDLLIFYFALIFGVHNVYTNMINLSLNSARPYERLQHWETDRRLINFPSWTQSSHRTQLCLNLCLILFFFGINNK